MTTETETETPPAAPRRPLDEKLETLPARPGVYLLKDRHGKVIYVGKARSLRSRVRTYFRGGDERMQVAFLMQRVTDFDSLVTASEKEALILENNLIKQYKPRYNIRLKDDKSYVSVKVTVQDAWPRVLVTRKIVKDGSRYFGPYHSAYSVRETLDTLRKVIPLRTCNDAVFRNRARPCLEYQIKRCLAPCVLPVDRDEYERHLREAMLLLGGKRVELIDQLRRDMQAAAEGERFEDAARLRDRLRAIEKTQERQQAVSHGGNDQDIFGIYREGGFIEAQVLFVRQGKLTGNQAYQLDDFELPDQEVLAALVTQFYQGERYLPDEVLLPIELEDLAVRAEYLSERKGRRVEVLYPQRGDRVRLLEMARENAAQSFRERQDGERQYERTSDELRRRLHLRNAPKRIECFDISNFQGGLAVGSMVTFDEGQPDKSGYRRFRIKTVVGQDDFGMMFEVLRRRFERARRDGAYPDLLVVDGGKGQLNVAVAVLKELGIDQVDAVGLAKMRVTRAARETEIERSDERVFLPGRANPVVLRRNANALFLLQRLRDEAHRFAITYHRSLRGKERLRSVLDSIPGVGAERRGRLLRAFGSVKRMRAATVEELAAVPGITAALAVAVRAALDRLAEVADRFVDTGRLRLVAVPLEDVGGGEEAQVPGSAAAAPDDDENVDSPESGDYA
ncbi:MAG: excinuclease ABC subunit UvrC [Candidatus Binatia bacterium]